MSYSPTDAPPIVTIKSEANEIFMIYLKESGSSLAIGSILVFAPFNRSLAETPKLFELTIFPFSSRSPGIMSSLPVVMIATVGFL